VFFVFCYILINIWEENEYIRPKKKSLNPDENGLENIIIETRKNVRKKEWKDIMRKRIMTNEFIKKAKRIHKDKYDYSKSVYVRGHDGILIICPIHGEFSQQPYSHLAGHGCMKCRNEKLPISIEKFVKKAKQVHGNKYDYSQTKSIPSNIKHRSRKVTIICKKHGQFEQFPLAHLKGNGCKKCYDDIHKITTKEFVQRCKKIHKNKYDYSKTIYCHPKIKVKIICKKHGEFNQLPYGHLGGQGCVKCTSNISNKEIAFLNHLNIPNTSNNRQKRILGFNVDGIDYNTNTIYEFLGDYWHGNPKIHNRKDINRANKTSFGKLYDFTFNKKFKILKENGYTIKYIWESDWDIWNKIDNKKLPILKY